MGTKDEEFRDLYDYVDSIPLSRAKKNFARDFADGVLTAELVHHEIPRIIELHNYSSAHSIPQKLYNWNTLNQKVFKHFLRFSVSPEDLQAICSCKAGAIEKLLIQLRHRLADYKDGHHEGGSPSSPMRRSPEKTPKALAGHRRQFSSPQMGNAMEPINSGVVSELQETNEILNLKIEKLEQLVQLKDAKIQALCQQLATTA